MEPIAKLTELRDKINELEEELNPFSWRTCAVSLLDIPKDGKGVPISKYGLTSGLEAIQSHLGISFEDVVYIFSLTSYHPFNTDTSEEYTNQNLIKRIDEVIRNDFIY